MSVKGLFILLIIFLLASGVGFGLPFLQNRLNPPAPTPSTQISTPPAPTETGCTENDQCTWFRKVVEINYGQPNEETQVFLTCANVNYKESCGLDCENYGTIHPSNKIDKCLCNQGFCESDEKAPLE